MAKYIFVISRLEPNLYEALARDFRDDPVVEIVLDRRFAERRRVDLETSVRTSNRRYLDRRMNPDSRGDLAAIGFVLVRVES